MLHYFYKERKRTFSDYLEKGTGEKTMEKTDVRYGAYVQILKEELVPAMGCTEPIALAYAAAVAREILGGMPERASPTCAAAVTRKWYIPW